MMMNGISSSNSASLLALQVEDLLPKCVEKSFAEFRGELNSDRGSTHSADEGRKIGKRKRGLLRSCGIETSDDVIGDGNYLRFLYVKPHREGKASKNLEGSSENKKGEKSSVKTLFIANIGCWWNEDDVRRLFSQFGRVESVELGTNGASTCRFARLRFEKSKSIKLVLAQVSATPNFETAVCWSDGDEKEATCFSRWKKEYNELRPGNDVLRAEAQEYLRLFASAESMESERRLKRSKEVDDDGFTPVSYKKSSTQMKSSALPVQSMTTGDSNSTHFANWVTGAPKSLELNRKKKATSLPDFYRFQMRETKRDRLAELRDQFEQDKARVDRLKASRRFKPF